MTYVVERSTVKTLAYVEPSRETLMAFLLHYVKFVLLLRCELQYRHHNSWISWICWTFLICHRWPSAKLKIAFHPIKETHSSNVLFDWKIRKKLKWKKRSSFLVKPKIQCIFHYIAENVIGTVRKCVQHCRCSGVESNHQARFSSLWSNSIPRPSGSKKNQFILLRATTSTFSEHIIVKSSNLTSYFIAYGSSPLVAATRHTVNELRKVENKRVSCS